jgi:hypothetical protein
LHQVAGGDVFLGAVHGRQIVFLLEVAPLFGLHAGVAVGNFHRASQSGAQVVQALLGAAVGLGLARVRVDHQVDAAGQVVDDDQLVHVHQHQVGRAAFHAGGERLDRRAQAGLDVAHGVVAEVARQAAAEARHAGTQGDLEAALVLLDEGQRIAVMGFGDLAVVQHLGAGAAGADHRAGRQADEGITAEAFAAHHRLHQAGHASALGAGVRQLQVDAQRGVQVGIGFGDQRDAVVALCGEGLEFDFGHVGSRERFICYRTRRATKKPGPGYWFRAWLCVYTATALGGIRVQGREGSSPPGRQTPPAPRGAEHLVLDGNVH